MRILLSNYAIIKSFAFKASKERVSISDTKDTRWFVVLNEDETVIAVAGLMKVGSGVRIKGVWTEPKHRGKGVGAKLTDHLIQTAENECASHVEAFAYNPSFYTQRGFKVFGSLPNGAIKVRRVF